MTNSPKPLLIFGREPAAALGVIEALLVALVAFGLGVTNESAGLLTAFLSLAIGAYQAWATKDTFLAALTGVAKAGVALVIYYGVTISPEQTAAIVTGLPLFVGFWLRTQTSPVVAPVDPSPTQVVASPLTAESSIGDGLGDAVDGVTDGIYGDPTKPTDDGPKPMGGYWGGV